MIGNLCFNDVAVGAAYGTSKAGIGIAGLGSFRPELIMRVCPSIAASPLHANPS